MLQKCFDACARLANRGHVNSITHISYKCWQPSNTVVYVVNIKKNLSRNKLYSNDDFCFSCGYEYCIMQLS